MGTYFSMLFDYQKRQRMKEHPIFKKIVAEFPLNEDKSGNTRFLLRQAHANKERENLGSIIKLNEWEKYYFSSGEKRKITDTLSQGGKLCGRTENELEKFAEELLNEVNSKGFNITKQAAANIIYIQTIDEPYNDYMRCCNVSYLLKQKYQDMKFSLTTPFDMDSYDVDILVSKSGVISGITVLPEESYGKDIGNLYKQKHEIFKMIWGCNTCFIFAAVNGKIAGNIPQFE